MLKQDAFTLFAVGGILAVTLFPTNSPETLRFTACVICGARGVADALVNVALFVPAGAAFAVATRSNRRIFAFALLLSGGIEALQFFIPGRYTSIGDLLFNTAGAFLGITLVRFRTRLLRPSRRSAVLLTLSAGAVATGTFALTAVLLEPAFPSSAYESRWTPTHPALDVYDGTVLRVTIGGRPIRPGRVLDNDGIRTAILSGATLEVVATAGSTTPRMALIFGLYDEHQREIAVIGAQRNGLVFGFRTRARAWRLDHPELYVPQVFANVRDGDTLAIVIRRAESGWHVKVGRSEVTNAGFTAGHGWALLISLDALSPPVQKIIDFLWVVLLILPLGYWASTGRQLLTAAGGAAFLLAAIPWMTSLLATPATQFIAVGVGVSVGRFARMARRAPARSKHRVKAH